MLPYFVRSWKSGPWFMFERLPEMYIKAHQRMSTFNYLHAKCQVPVSMHMESADRRLRQCDFGLRNSKFSAENKVFKGTIPTKSTQIIFAYFSGK